MLTVLLLANVALMLSVLGAAAWRKHVAASASVQALAIRYDSFLADLHADDEEAVVSSLVALGHQPSESVSALPTALALTESPTAPVRQAAGMLVARIVEINPKLLAICWPTRGVLARASIVSALPAPGPQESRQGPEAAIVRDACTDADAGVRRQAARKLAWLGTNDLDRARELTSDADEETQRLAYEYLSTTGDAATVVGLVSELADASARRAQFILDALAQLGTRFSRVLEDLVRSSPDVGTRVAAVRALGAAGREASLETIAAVLDDPSRDIRRAAALALADLASTIPVDRRGAIGRTVAHQLARESSVSATLAQLDALDVCRCDEGALAIRGRLETMHPSIRARAEEILEDFARTAVRPSTQVHSPWT
jgi:HEAT repeat protein